MSGITTGVGIFSGIDSASLIEQLIAVDARPRVFAQQRIIALQQQQAAYLDLNSSLLSLQTSAGIFDRDDIFKSTTASSSDENVLAATANTFAQPGLYSFTVDRLVSTHQMLSRGFVDSDVSGIDAGEFTFEIGGGALSSDTKLAELNGGAGIERGEIEIRDASGASGSIDLSRAISIQDVLDAFNSSADVSVTAAVVGDAISITDTSGGAGALVISDAFGSQTATSLGIVGNEATGAITGTDIRTISGATALSLLNDGNGVHIRNGSADLEITARDGTVFNVDFGEILDGEDVLETQVATVQDVLDRIESQTSGHITAAISADGKGISLTDTVGGGGNLIVANQAGRETATDLGIETTGVASDTLESSRLIASLGSTLARNLNGGAGLSATDLTVVDRAGNAASISIDASVFDGSVDALLEDINQRLAAGGAQITVGLNAAGNGFSVTDTSGGTLDLAVSGGAATELGIEIAGASASYVDGTNAQTKWIGLGTRLSELNVGQGIGTGEFRITDASGATSVVNIDDNVRTVEELLQLLNSRPVGITASINASGDGIEITDTTGATGSLKIEAVSGDVAKNLNLLGEDDDASDGLTINGSYERTVVFEATDTLDDVAEKINLDGIGVIATVINDGSNASPFRLNFTSRFTGESGRVIVDTKGFDLGLSDLSKGEDAVVFFGGTDAASGVLLTSSTNTLDSVVRGVTIDLKTASDDPVELSVSSDTGAIETAINDFVESYNTVLDTISRYTGYDADSNTRGVLLGDSTTSQIQSSLFSTIQSEAVGVEGEFQYLFEVGVRIGDGARLEFDRDRFRSALETDPDNVADLFGANTLIPSEPVEIAPGVTVDPTEDQFSQLGVAELVDQLVERLSNSVDGVLTGRDQALDTQIQLQEDRIERIDSSLDVKRQKLQRDFIAMEQTIALLQSQQQALGSLSSLG